MAERWLDMCGDLSMSGVRASEGDEREEEGCGDPMTNEAGHPCMHACLPAYGMGWVGSLFIVRSMSISMGWLILEAVLCPCGHIGINLQIGRSLSNLVLSSHRFTPVHVWNSAGMSILSSSKPSPAKPVSYDHVHQLLHMAGELV